LNSVLPYDYEVEYLESSGTQWIDTGIAASVNKTFMLRMMFTNNSSTTQVFFGIWFTTETPKPQKQAYIKSNNTLVINGLNVCSAYSNQAITSNTKFDIYLSSYSTTATNASLYLFARNVDSGSVSGINNMRLYRMIVRNTYNVEKYIIPVVKNGIPCLYDKIGDEFYYNQGTGDFIAGPRV